VGEQGTMPPMFDDEAAALGVFEKDVGEWDVELQVTPYPGADINRTAGVAVNRMVGGRWLVSDLTTDSGFTGHGVYGWDPAQRAYVGIWVDAMSGGIAQGTGGWDEASRTMTYDFEVELQDQMVRYREVTQALEDGTQVYRNLRTMPGGREHEIIRATYRRRG
jgi:Protein of unknown function (DUF1579)